jgi:hypothetical protein
VSRKFRGCRGTADSQSELSPALGRRFSCRFDDATSALRNFRRESEKGPPTATPFPLTVAAIFKVPRQPRIRFSTGVTHSHVSINPGGCHKTCPLGFSLTLLHLQKVSCKVARWSGPAIEQSIKIAGGVCVIDSPHPGSPYGGRGAG